MGGRRISDGLTREPPVTLTGRVYTPASWLSLRSGETDPGGLSLSSSLFRKDSRLVGFLFSDREQN